MTPSPVLPLPGLPVAVVLGTVLVALARGWLGDATRTGILPGLLAAVLLARPVDGAVAILGGVVTAGLGWGLTEGPIRLGWWTRPPGHVRTFALLLLSLPVRVALEGGSAPGLAALLGKPGGDGFDLLGPGLFLVPLVALACAADGIPLGLARVAAVTAPTWGVLAGLGSLGLTHLAWPTDGADPGTLPVLADPRLGLLVVAAAALGAWNTARYGWDLAAFGTPVLLVLVAGDPLRLLASLAVALTLHVAGEVAGHLPGLRRRRLPDPLALPLLLALAAMLAGGLDRLLTALELPFLGPDPWGLGWLLAAHLAFTVRRHHGHLRALVPATWTWAQGLGAGMVVALLLAALQPDPGNPGEATPGPLAPTRQGGSPAGSMDRAVILAGAAATRQGSDGAEVARRHATEIHVLERLGKGESDIEASLAALASPHRVLSLEPRADGRRCVGLRETALPLPAGTATPPGLPSTWWCGGEGPGLYVPTPLADPDSLPVAAWLAQRVDLSWIVVEGTDPADLPTRERAAIRAAVWQRFAGLRRALPPRPLLVVVSGEGHSRIEPRGSSTTLARMLAPHWPLSFGLRRDHGELEPLWHALQDGDALAVLSVEELARRMTPGARAAEPRLEDTLQRLSTTPPPCADLHGNLLPADQRVALARVLLDTTLRWAGEGLAGRQGVLSWLADSLGVDLEQVVEADGQTWLVLSESTPSGFGTWVVGEGRGATWTVAAPLSADAPGTARVAVAMLRSLGGRVAWISQRGSRFGDGDPLASPGADLALPALLVHRALQPRSAADRPGDRRQLLLVRARPSLADDAAPLVLSRGTDRSLEDRLGALPISLEEALAPWPGFGVADGSAATASLSHGDSFATRYLDAFPQERAFDARSPTSDPVFVAWIDPAVLAEVAGTTAHARRVAWYRAQGVPVVSRARAADWLDAVDPTTPMPPPPAWAALRAHAETPSLDSLREAASQVGLRVLDTGLRLVLLGRGPGWLCASTARAPASAVGFPYQGCWRTP